MANKSESASKDKGEELKEELDTKDYNPLRRIGHKIFG